MPTALLGFLLLPGCDTRRLTVENAARVLTVAAPALQMESDVELARAAIPGQLKTVEGLWLNLPEHRGLTALLARGFCDYAFGIVEDEAEAAEQHGDFDGAARLANRATSLYLRCMNYGLKLLGPDWEKDLYGTLDAFEARVRTAGRHDVPGMFYTARGLAGAISLSRDDIELVAYLSRARVLFERVVELDEAFAHGQAHLALGAMHSVQGSAGGGDPARARWHFERAIALSGGRLLLAKVMMARYYARAVGDAALCRQLLVEVLRTSPAVFPEMRLANELAHLRARRYLEQSAEWF